LPDGLTLSGTWPSARVVDLLLTSSVVTTRWISPAWLAVATDARTAIKLNVLKSMTPLSFFVAARSPVWATVATGSVAIFPCADKARPGGVRAAWMIVAGRRGGTIFAPCRGIETWYCAGLGRHEPG
jgi:hypothetical protein